MGTVKNFLAPALARRSRLAGHGSPVTARRSRLAALAARGAAEDFSTFQVSFVAPSRSRATASRQKPPVTFAKAAVSFPKPAATSSKVTVTFPKVAATSGKVAIPFAKVAVTFRRETATFASFSSKTPRFCGFYRKSTIRVGRAVLCAPPVANLRVRVHHDGGQGTARPTNFGQS